MLYRQQIDPITQEFIRVFGHLTQDQLNTKPSVNQWSIAQNIDHLLVINSTYFPIIESLRAGTYTLPFQAKIGWVVSKMGNAILKSVQPEAKKKIQTFPIWEPSRSEISAGILDRFVGHQEEIKNMMESSADLLEEGAIISSPGNRNIVYTLEQAFDIIIAHERRHLAQAKRVLEIIS